ncbi:MAG: maleylpyruvate isomerase family mycothiol-dependent enzyme [Actinomycetota bacterium]
MTLTSPGRTIPIAELRGLSAEDSKWIGAFQNERMLRLLRTLDPDEWDAPTDCDRWSVKDIVSHLIGWAEFFSSGKEFRHQFAASIRRRKELGNPVNAQNEQQVEDRRHLSPDELIERFEGAMARFLNFRMKVGRYAHFVPWYDPSIIGLSNLGYIARVIYTRDVFMHRIDISRATDRPVVLEHADAELLADVVRDWAKRRKVDATIDLGSVGKFLAGAPHRATIAGNGVQFSRVMTGRAGPETLALEGDVAAATGWLAAGVPF